MPDDPKKTGRQDDERINVNQSHELKYWKDKFGVTEDALKKAVQKVGPMDKDVKKELGK
jgi:hypothetical protein